MINAANANIGMVTEHTQVVPGHGPVGGRADLVEYRDMLVSIRNRVAELKQEGKSLQQVVAAKPTAPFDAKWGQSIIDPTCSPRSSTGASEPVGSSPSAVPRR